LKEYSYSSPPEDLHVSNSGLIIILSNGSAVKGILISGNSTVVAEEAGKAVLDRSSLQCKFSNNNCVPWATAVGEVL
jgi:hypothetical protein